MNDSASLPPATVGRSLDDWFSPILIKELRQGMRGRVFVITFLILQAFLILLILGNVAAASQGMLLRVQTGFFWGILGVALTVLMPLRGLNAISQEVKSNTMETVLLTRLTSWRVVFGKWSALFAQSLLFATAVMPYVVVRYFIGGTDVVEELLTLIYLLWLSGILLALAITASGIQHTVIRILFFIAVVVPCIGAATGVFQMLRSFSWICVGWLLLTTVCLPALLFELALASIAPPAENHSIRRRLLALGYFGLSMALWPFHGNSETRTMGLVFSIGALIGICYFELSEKPRLLPGLVAPLNRFGVLGRFATLLLLPGWPSALLFSLLMIPLGVWGIAANGQSFGVDMDGLKIPLWICAILGGVLIPVCFCHLVWRKLNQVFFAVIIYNVALSGLALVLRGFDRLTNTEISFVLSLLPSPAALMVVTDGRGNSAFEYSFFLFLNCFSLAAVTLLLFAHGLPWYRDLWALLHHEEATAPSSTVDKLSSEKF